MTVASIEVFAPQLVQGTFATRPVPVPAGCRAADLTICVLTPAVLADPAFEVFSELEVLAAGVWRRISTAEFPGAPVSQFDPVNADRLRLVIGLSRPAVIAVRADFTLWSEG